MRLLFLCFAISMIACNSRQEQTPAQAPGNTASSSTTIDGSALFSAKCAVCHRCEGEFTGPPLKGSAGRWNDDKALYDFVRNSQAMIRTNDHAAELYRKYNSAYMTAFPELTDPEIKAILDHCGN